MARRRIVYPDFFSDPDMVSNLNFVGRLFYMGTWVAAEDSGVFENNPLALKMKIFPGDNISLDDIRGFMDKLCGMGKLIPYTVGSKQYCWLKNFFKYQKVDKPSPPLLPLPTWLKWHGEDELGPQKHKWFYSVEGTIPGIFDEQSTNIRPKDKISENKISLISENKTDEDQNTKVPYLDIQEAFNRICRSFAQVKTLSSKRKEKLRIRWREIESLERFEEIFRHMEGSAFLKGQNKSGWRATFDWLLENDNNWLKVLEGQYDDKKGVPDTDGFSKYRQGVEEFGNFTGT